MSHDGSSTEQTKNWEFLYEGRPFAATQSKITLTELRNIVGESSSDPIVEEIEDGAERQVSDGETVSLEKTRRFGRSPRFKRGNAIRQEEELALLQEVWPTLQRSAGRWCEIAEFPLPKELYNRETTTLAFLLPVEYPMNPPDNFYVAAGLRFSDGRMLSNYSEGAGPVGGNWGIFSFHKESWRPTNDARSGDNLSTFLRAVNLRLQEKH